MWLKMAILAIQEAEIQSILVQDPAWTKSSQDSVPTNKEVGVVIPARCEVCKGGSWSRLVQILPM
jgi:hypothetical protein